MKTKEFIEQVEAYGYEVEERGDVIVVCKSGIGVVSVSKNELLIIDSNWSGMQKLDVDDREKLFSIAVEYVTTPIEEREDREYVVRRNSNLYLFRLSIEENEARFSSGTSNLAKASKFDDREVAEKVAELANLLSFKAEYYEVVDVKDL